MKFHRAARALALALSLGWGLLACGGGGGGGSGDGDDVASVVISGFDAIAAAQQFNLPLTVQGSPAGARLSWEVRDNSGNSVQGTQQAAAAAMPIFPRQVLLADFS